MTPKDWREAAALYPKTSSDGFYISDDAKGKVNVHNDLTEANKVANTSVLSATLDEAKSVLGVGAAWTGIMTGAAAVFGPAFSFGETTALACASTTALWSGAIAAVVGGGVLAADAGKNYFRQSAAAEDVREGADLEVG